MNKLWDKNVALLTSS